MNKEKTSVLSGQLINLAEQFGKLKLEAKEFLDGIDEADFNKRPPNGGWSVAECIEHMNRTGDDYTAQIEKGLMTAYEKNLTSSGPYTHSWFAGKFIKTIEPPPKMKLRAPRRWKPEKPESVLDMKKVVSDFMRLQDRFIGLINRSDGINLMKIKLPSPATKYVKFSAFEMFGVNAAHERRHLFQAKKTLSVVRGNNS